MSVWSLGQEDPLEEEMATHSSILAWKTPWGHKRVSIWAQTYTLKTAETIIDADSLLASHVLGLYSTALQGEQRVISKKAHFCLQFALDTKCHANKEPKIKKKKKSQASSGIMP